MNPISERRLLDEHGLLALMRVDGDDTSPATAARTSYRKDADAYTHEQNTGLADYLIRHHHSTPVEFAEAVFFMVMPIFVARQMVRHRLADIKDFDYESGGASINEESLRYVSAREAFYVPAVERMQKQSQTNKQGSSVELVDDPELCRAIMNSTNQAAFATYQRLLDEGLAKELARSVLPLSTYTAWYWKCDLRNILHLLWLRLDPHAQYEIRVYADAILDLLRPHFPNLIASWENHERFAIKFSRDELVCLSNVMDKDVDVVQSTLDILGESRSKEFWNKLEKFR